MKKLSLILVTVIGFCVSVHAQDVITLKNGTDINALVQEIRDVDVKYKRFDNPSGPNYILKKSEILIIRYANGNKEIFSEKPKSVNTQEVANETTFKRSPSTVYVCYTMPLVYGGVLDISFNGEDAFKMYRQTKKVCHFSSEGKLVLTLNTVLYNGYGTAFYMYDELPLQLSEASVHYIKIRPQGASSIIFEELSEEDGKKEFDKRKYDETDAYTEPSSNYFASVQTKDKSTQPMVLQERFLTADWRDKLFAKVSDYNNSGGSTNSWYKGQVKDKKSHGMGIQKFENGTLYIGDWLNANFNGYGIYIAPDGYSLTNCPNSQIYIGNWENNLKSGIGTCYDKDGNLIYYGNFKDNKPIDMYPTKTVQNDYSSYKFLFYSWENGDMYLGETKNGSMTGYGVYVWTNGNARFGNFVSDKPKGVVMFLARNAEWELGGWNGGSYATISSSSGNRERTNMNSQARTQAFSQAMGAISSGLNSIANTIGQSQGSSNSTNSSSSATNSSSGSSSGESGCNCATMQDLYNRIKNGLASAQKCYDDKSRSASTHALDGQNLRNFQQQKQDIEQQARKCGCSLH